MGLRLKVMAKVIVLATTAVISLIALPGNALAAPASGVAGPNSAAPTVISGDSSNAAITPQVMSDCPATNLCVWVNKNYSGGPAKFSGNNTSWSAFPSGGCQVRSWNDCASSGYNHGTSGLGVDVFRDTSFQGDGACLPKGWSFADFSKLAWPGTSDKFNDSISSNFWTDAC